MYLLRKSSDSKTLNKLIRCYSLARKSHYDVLNLRRNCSEKEIKEAYIQMSKEYHPDKNKDKKAQEKFVRIVEAYNVLSKPSSRARYDSLTEINTSTTSSSYVYRTQAYAYNNYRNNPNYNFYYGSTSKSNTSSQEKDNENKECYYGFAGIRKLPNYYIICLCCGIAFIGVLLQVYVIRNMYAIQRSKAQERSKYLAEELDRVRAAARDNGNELQTRLLLDKIVTAANPTVATASLGQALATENKDATDTLLTEFGIGETANEWYDAKEGTKVNFYEILHTLMSYLS